MSEKRPLEHLSDAEVAELATAPMKVYVLEVSDYDNWEILGVYASRASAVASQADARATMVSISASMQRRGLHPYNLPPDESSRWYAACWRNGAVVVEHEVLP